MLGSCFADVLTDDAWLPALKTIIPTCGLGFTGDAEACRRTQADWAAVLQITNVWRGVQPCR